MKRRSLLKVGLLGSAILAIGGAGGLALWPGDASVQPKRTLAVISIANFPILVAVASRVLHGTTANPLDIAHRVDDALRFATPQSQGDLNKVLALLENALPGLLLRGKATPFTLLDEAGQDAALGRWRDSRLGVLRGAYHALRKLCLASHYAHPSSFVEVDYPGPTLIKPEPPPMTARGALAVSAAAVVNAVEGMPQ